MRRSTRSSTASARGKAASDKVPTKRASVTKSKLEKKIVIKEGKVVNAGIAITKLPCAEHGLKTETSTIPKLITIEACKSWGAFKSRAIKILKGVGSKAKVEINKEKPGKGNFVITVSGMDEPVVELLQMKRPFPSLKALNMDDVIEKILHAIEE